MKQRSHKSSACIVARYIAIVILISAIPVLQNGTIGGVQSASAIASPRFVATPGTPIAIVANEATNKLYIVNYNNSITVLDGKTEKLMSQITLYSYNEDENGTAVVSLAVNSETNKIYAASSLGNTIYVIDGALDSVIGTISLDKFERGQSIVVSPLTNKVYVSGYNDILYVIDGENDRIVERIDIGDHSFISGDQGGVYPAELTLNPNTNLIYATNPSQGLIAVINGSTNAIVGNVTIQFPLAALINPETNSLYVSYQSSQDIKVIDGTSLEVVATIDDAYAAGFRNSGLALNRESNLVYATKYGSGEDSVVLIDGETHNSTEIRIGFAIRALGVNEATDRLYIAVDDYSRLYVIDNATFGKLRYQVQAGNKTFDISYVSTDSDTRISKIATAAFLTMTVEVNTGSRNSGQLDITFPREFLDLVFTGHDPIVFVDGVEGAYQEVGLSCDAITMRFAYTRGLETIEFAAGDATGDHVHPRPQIFQPRPIIQVGSERFEPNPDLDSRICGYSLDMESKKLHFDLEPATEKEKGAYSIVVRHDFLGGNYSVLVDGKAVPHSEEFIDASRVFPPTSQNYSRIWFEYDSEAKSIDIVGSSVIPEIDSAIATIVGGVSIMGVLAATRYGSRRSTQ